jgi:putative tricarboxylic transport membrane protein
MTRSDRFSALFFLVLAIYICKQSMGIGLGTLRGPGPGLLSFGAGAGVGLLCLALLIQTFLPKKDPDETEQDGESGSTTVKTIAICISMFIYTIAVSWLGFVLSTLFFVLFLFRLVESEPWWRSVMKAALVTIGIYAFFVVWLGMNLPKGILPW